MASPDDIPKWQWASRPTTAEEFDAMMVSLDRHLASEGRAPSQRGLKAALVVSSTLGLSGTPILGGRSGRGAPFSPVDLLARVHDWYVDTYAEKANIDFSPGSVVMQLHGNLWRLKMPWIMGSAQAFIDRDLSNQGNRLSKPGSPPVSLNVLRSVEGITQPYASRLTNEDLRHVMETFAHGFLAVAWLDNLKGNDLFNEARVDYRHSVEALLRGGELGKARWETAQCAEKVFKGLLAQAGHSYPTKGGQGHDIAHLGDLVREKLRVRLVENDLTAAHCSTAMRYGEEKTSLDEALAAHQALLRILNAIRSA